METEAIEATAERLGHVLGVWHEADGGALANACAFGKCGAAVLVSGETATGEALRLTCAHDRAAAERMTGSELARPRIAPPGPGGSTSTALSPDVVTARAPAPRPVRPIVVEQADEAFAVPPPLEEKPDVPAGPPQRPGRHQRHPTIVSPACRCPSWCRPASPSTASRAGPD